MTGDIIQLGLSISVPVLILFYLLYQIRWSLSQMAAESHRIARFLERLIEIENVKSDRMARHFESERQP